MAATDLRYVFLHLDTQMKFYKSPYFAGIAFLKRAFRETVIGKICRRRISIPRHWRQIYGTFQWRRSFGVALSQLPMSERWDFFHLSEWCKLHNFSKLWMCIFRRPRGRICTVCIYIPIKKLANEDFFDQLQPKIGFIVSLNVKWCWNLFGSQSWLSIQSPWRGKVFVFVHVGLSVAVMCSI